MAPILIDNRGVIKLSLISLLITIIIFATGYFSGYQRAIQLNTMVSETEILTLPVQQISLVSDVEPQSPEKMLEGEEIDVDRPRATSDLDTPHVIKKQGAENIASLVVPVSSAIPNEQSDGDATKSKEMPAAVESIHTDETAVSQRRILSASEWDKIKYSVQVGMYGSLPNAESMKKKLQAQHFDAYVSDYTNKKDEVRYNVRFGYFVDKKSAVSALKRYKDSKSGDGYLVMFSLKNRLNLADIKDAGEDIRSLEAPLDDTEEKNNALPERRSAETKSLDMTERSLSQVGIMSKFQPEPFVSN